MASDQILKTFRYRGERFGPGDEERLAQAVKNAPKDAAEPDTERLRERGVIGKAEKDADPRARRVAGPVVQPENEKAGAAEGRRNRGSARAAATPPGAGTTRPTVEDLPEHLQTITDPDLIRRMAAEDERTTAAALYEARLAELEQK